MLIGEQATEGRLKQLQLADFSLVHLATHGWIDPASPSRSGLVLASDPRSPEDGILQPREILKLSLDAELVTLSACQTGLGELVTGEGMVSLARSFFYAGTDSVVASLWSVNDRASADFMELFYSALADGASKADALRQAKIQLRQRAAYEHPYYWAPYVLIGRGEGVVAFPARGLAAVSSLALITALLLVGLIVALVIARRRAR